jgi:hypothetical protein
MPSSQLLLAARSSYSSHDGGFRCQANLDVGIQCGKGSSEGLCLRMLEIEIRQNETAGCVTRGVASLTPS